MHLVDTTQFFLALSISVLATTLISRFLFVVFANWEFGFPKLATVHGASLSIVWALFVVWWSTPGDIHWWAGHVAFAPQALWFMFDILHSTGEVIDADSNRVSSEESA